MRPVRALLAIAVLAVTAVLTVGPASPATAGVDCPYGLHRPPCDLIYVLDIPVFDDGCLSCPEYVIFFDEDLRVLPENQLRYHDHLNGGLAWLHQAATEKDQFRAQELRDRALKEFTAAAAVLDKASVSVRAVGVFDPKTSSIGPHPEPWLEAVAKHLAGGLNALNVGAPEPKAAMEHFDEAYAELAHAGQVG